MWLKRIKLTNVGPHQDLDLSFEFGLVGLFGENGSGKSTAIDAAYALLTNDWGRFAGVKADCICDLSDPDTDSNAYGEWEHDGAAFSLFRALRHRKRSRGETKPLDNELVIEGKHITDDKAITAELTKRLGVNRRLIGTYIFVKQLELFGVISDTPGERAIAFQALCGTEKAKVVHKAIDEMLTHDTSLQSSVVDDIDDLKRRLATAEQGLKASHDQYAAAIVGLLKPEGLQKARTVVAKRNAYRQHEAELEPINQQRQQASGELVKAQAASNAAAAIVTELEAFVVELSVEVDAARLILADVEKARQAATRAKVLRAQAEQAVATRAQQRKTLDDQLTGLRQSLNDRRIPAAHAQDGEYADLLASITTYAQKINHMQGILQRFKDRGIVECPTCGTPVANMDSHFAALQEEVSRLAIETAPARKSIKEIDSARRNVDLYNAFKRDQDVLIAGVEQRLAYLEAVPLPPLLDIDDVPEVDEPALRQAVKDHDDQRRNLQEAVNEAALAAASVARYQERLSGLEAQDATLRNRMAMSRVDDALYEKALRAIARHEEATPKAAAAKVMVQSNQQQADAAQENLAAAMSRQARSGKGRRFAERLKTIRDRVMHHQALPQAVARANLADTESDLNRTLGRFGGPFWAETSDDLSFRVHFPGAPARPAERLSVGQKGVLAIAFRQAMVSLYGDLGMMTLDEPTAGFDQQNVEYMADALAKFAADIRGKRQVIVITHATALQRAFDQVLELGKK